jgi:hypothetical protein
MWWYVPMACFLLMGKGGPGKKDPRLESGPAELNVGMLLTALSDEYSSLSATIGTDGGIPGSDGKSCWVVVIVSVSTAHFSRSVGDSERQRRVGLPNRQ